MHFSLSLSTLALVLSTLTLITPTTCSPIVSTSVTTTTGPAEPAITFFPPTASSEAQVHRLFSIPTLGFENLAFRSNGQILATTAFPYALLWYIDPLSIRPPILLQNLTSLVGTGGITELAPDIFYFVASGGGANGGPPHYIYSVDMRPFVVLPDGEVLSPPIMRKAGEIPDAILTNGMTNLDRRDDFVLVADTLVGGVWKFNVETGASELIIQDVSMKGPPNETDFAAYGINGLRTRNGTLFYCNSGAQKMYKMPLNADGSSAGNATLVTSGLSCDDFTIDPWGFTYVASPSNALIQVDTRTGAQLVVAGTFDNTVSDIVGATSAAFGVTPLDRTSVYITTNGGAFMNAQPGSQGISRVDVKDLAEVFLGRNEC